MSFLCFSILCLCCACAKVGPPQGGAVDDTPPQILSHSPDVDQLNVSLERYVEIVFSEPMDRRRTEEAIFISPSDSLGFRWRGRTLRIDLGLRPDRTYVVTVGTGARDLRNNALEQSFSLAFATGARLDQGALRGRVYQRQAPLRGAHIWAYDLSNFSGQVGREKPAYQTQSGVDGQYGFLRLASGRYQLLAFVDDNKDSLPNSDEWVGLPARDVVVRDTLGLAGNLELVRRQTGGATLERIQSLHSGALLLLFSEPVNIDALELRIHDLSVELLYATDDARKVYAVTAQQEAGKTYDVDRVVLGGRVLAWSESLRGSGRRDTKPPEWIGLESAILTANDPLKMRFSEAMRADVQGMQWVGGDSTLAPQGAWRWLSPTHVEFMPDSLWEVGSWSCILKGSDWTDRAGLALADSTLAVVFSVVEARASVAGRVLGVQGVAEVRLRAEQMGRDYAVRCSPEGDFVVDGLPADTYQLWSFDDLNGDGKWDAGTLFPFIRPEAITHYGASIELAADDAVVDLRLEFR
ncbi:MAG: hypothetical protein CME28_02775 [Gemmatimonadetes bacterium]|nr:hypothetical protein [Gemmatimonadota bacterium]